MSLAAAILTTNNFGGGAVGFRHATYLAPAMLVFLLPWIAEPGAAAEGGRHRDRGALDDLDDGVRFAQALVAAHRGPSGRWRVESLVPLPSQLIIGRLLAP